MRLNLLLVLCFLYLFLPLAYAQQNTVIEEIGTVPNDLIEGMSVQLFANLSNRGNESAEIEVEFRLDSTIVGKRINVSLAPGTSFQVLSDTTKVSPGNNNIEAIVYFPFSYRIIDRKSAQIVVNKKFSLEGNKDTMPSTPESPSNLEFIVLIILMFVGIIILLYIYMTRKKELSNTVKPGEVPEPKSSEIANKLSNDIKWFLSNLKKQSEESGQEKEYKLLSEYIRNINSIVENIGKNNLVGAEFALEDIKRGTVNLISVVKEVQKDGDNMIKEDKILSTEPVKSKFTPEIADKLSNDIKLFLNDLQEQSEESGLEKEYKLLSEYIRNVDSIVENIGKNNLDGSELAFENVKNVTAKLISKLKKAQNAATFPTKTELISELEKQRDEMNRKKQFIDVVIPDLLLDVAEKRMSTDDIKAAEILISGAKALLENEEVLHRLRKLREIGF